MSGLPAELAAFLGTLVLVFGRAIQQQNVVHGHYWAAALTPMLIAAGEIAIIGAVVIDGWSSWPWISAGGGVGAVTAMSVHRRLTCKSRSAKRPTGDPGAPPYRSTNDQAFSDVCRDHGDPPRGASYWYGHKVPRKR